MTERVREYHRLGIGEFALTGHPHAEEAYWFGEGVLPLLRDAGLWRRPGAADGAAGPRRRCRPRPGCGR
ncbi:hypothetical protein [Streptomyces lydicus]|uniref:hypothetical protein n=1 Tax=Streptomyces lydicus TaxID=47763 RepID=UPI0036A25456